MAIPADNLTRFVDEWPGIGIAVGYELIEMMAIEL
jgi:hypothetical protein